MERGAFTLVLIDGDDVPFTDELVRRGLQGGEDAASALLKATFAALRHEPSFRHEEKVVVKVYANLRCLGRTYTNHGITHGVDVLGEFVTGFNKVNENCDFIDAGNAKEGADRKLRATLDRDIYNVHCRRIILAASTDNTYASYLKHFYDINLPDKVWLVEGPGFAKEFDSILHLYKQIQFPDIFRSEKLPPAQHSPRLGQQLPAAYKRKAESPGDESARQHRRVGSGAVDAPQPYVAEDATNSAADRPSDTALVVHEGSAAAVNTYTPDELQVIRALIRASLEQIARDPTHFDSGAIKRAAVNTLGGYNHWFCSVQKPEDGLWF